MLTVNKPINLHCIHFSDSAKANANAHCEQTLSNRPYGRALIPPVKYCLFSFQTSRSILHFKLTAVLRYLLDDTVSWLDQLGLK